MPTTSDAPQKKTKAINACVTDGFYEAFAAKAAEVPGRTPTEFARYLCERAVYGTPNESKLMAEVAALKLLVLNGIIAPTPGEDVTSLLSRIEQAKHDVARRLMAQ